MSGYYNDIDERFYNTIIMGKRDKKSKENKDRYYHIKISNTPIVKVEEESVYYKYACLYATRRYKYENKIKKFIIMCFYAKLRSYITLMPLCLTWIAGIFFLTFGLSLKYLFIESSIIVFLFFIFVISFIRMKCQMMLDEYELYNHGLSKNDFPIYRYIRKYGDGKTKIDMKNHLSKKKKESYMVEKIDWSEIKKSSNQ